MKGITMPEEKNVVNRINWGNAFYFPKIFKSFKIATQPGKILLALMGIILFVLGGKILDTAWSVTGTRVAPNEILLYGTEGFDGKKSEWKQNRLMLAAALEASVSQPAFSRKHIYGFNVEQRNYNFSVSMIKAFGDRAEKYDLRNTDFDRQASMDKILAYAKKEDKNYNDLIASAKEKFDAQTKKFREFTDKIDEIAAKEARESYDKKIKILDDNLKENKDNPEFAKTYKASKNEKTVWYDKELKAIKQDSKMLNTILLNRKKAFSKAVRQIEGKTIFAAFCNYEKNCLYEFILAVKDLNFTAGLGRHDFKTQNTSKLGSNMSDAQLRELLSTAKASNPGAIYWLVESFKGYRWLLSQHLVYAIILIAWILGLYALFGGAIYRMSAIQFARGQKISMFEALGFAREKFFSFFTAPLIPLAAIFFGGVLLMLGGLVGSIPGLGDVLLMLLFFIAIFLGFAIAFMTIGLVAGGAFMYPTIAVEGSDSFDSISRSFSYIFSKPWKTIFYIITSLVYGVLTYLFIRAFVFIALSAVHCFTKWGIFGGGGDLGPHADKLDVVWSKPEFWNLYSSNSEAMTGWQNIWGSGMGFWVWLAASITAAYLISYLATSSTITYYLLRKQVDSTDLDDLYIEQEELSEVVEITVEPAEPATKDSEKTSSENNKSEEAEDNNSQTEKISDSANENSEQQPSENSEENSEEK